MQTLTHLVELKRAATTGPAIDRYAAALIHATTTWTGTTAQIHTSTLSIDALIDRIAHEAPQEATGADLSAEHASDVHQWESGVSEPADRRTA